MGISAEKLQSLSNATSEFEASETDKHLFVSYPESSGVRHLIRAHAARTSSAVRLSTIARTQGQNVTTCSSSSAPKEVHESSERSIRKEKQRRLGRKTAAAVTDCTHTTATHAQPGGELQQRSSAFLIEFVLGLQADRRQLCAEICSSTALFQALTLYVNGSRVRHNSTHADFCPQCVSRHLKTIWLFNPDENGHHVSNPTVLCKLY